MNAATAQTTHRMSYSEPSSRETLRPSEDVVEYMKSYARQNPETAAIWCFCIGFIVGWKLKPW